MGTQSMTTDTKAPSTGGDDEAVIAAVLERARRAAETFKTADQETVDTAVTGIAWAVYKPENARRLAELAVEKTGLGNVPDKIMKNQRKTFGTLRDLLRVRTVGVIEEDPARGLVKIAKPVGVVGAITPSTNPAATPVNKAMLAIKGRNAIIIAPSPSAWETTNETCELMRAELAKCGLPEDLIQIVPAPANKVRTNALMKGSDLVVCTGSQNNVRASYSSGTPALGVGLGNAPVIIDDTADLEDAAPKILASKVFDNSTSCSSENAVVILDSIYNKAIAALERVGGYMCNAEQRQRILDTLWQDGKLNRHLIAKDADVLAKGFDLPSDAYGKKFFMVEETGFGPDYPLSGEKLSLVLTVYRARDFDDAKRIVKSILDYQGRGHSCGIHTQTPEHADELAHATDVVRVLVNQAHTYGNGGGFDNGLPFTLSMGCGTWGGNSITENLNWKHFVNITHLVRTIPEDKPGEDELFGAYWKRYGA